MMCPLAPESFRNRRVTVMGLGLFGGGLGVARFLARQGAQVTVTDLRAEKDLAESLAALKGLPILYHLGGHPDAAFDGMQTLFVNPGVKWNSPILAKARSAGIPIQTEINLLLSLLPCRDTIAVTGTNGKTTATALVGEMLKAAGRKVWVGGNIGGSLLDRLDEIRPGDAVVLELSSFQLYHLPEIQRSVRVAVITNLTPNHLDWHPDLAHYRAAKQNLLRFQTADATAILNADDPDVRTWETPGARRFFGLGPGTDGAFLDGGTLVLAEGGAREILLDRREMKLPGLHNAANALAAALAARAVGAPATSIRQVIRDFRGVEHRLELSGERNGVRFYNDSIATTPESTMMALRSFESPMIVILGGSDKGLPFDALAAEIVRRPVKFAALYGRMGPAIRDAIERAGRRTGPSLVTADRFDDAVAAARMAAAPGDVVLLSPACASFDQFRNFAERGKRFKELI
ncbi:MAG: UDP-N-acetylmuramoyl-L-alanine--D-glutamate ligase [Planctomycetota bacterium]